MARKQTRRKWTKAQKQQIAKRARRGLASGKKLSAIARSLDIHENSLRLWMKQSPEAGLRQVQIVGAHSVGIVVVTPDGFRIEGLDADSAAALLERVR